MVVGVHLRQLERDGLMLDDRHSHAGASLGVSERVLVAGARQADESRGKPDSHLRQAAHHPRALPFSADQGIGGDLDVVEDQFGVVPRVPPRHPRPRASRYSLGRCGNDKNGDALPQRPVEAGSRQHEVQIRDAAIRHKC